MKSYTPLPFSYSSYVRRQLCFPPKTHRPPPCWCCQEDKHLSISTLPALKVIRADCRSVNDLTRFTPPVDGKLAYVSTTDPAYNTLAVVDLIAQKTLTSVDLGALRGRMDWTRRRKVCFTAEAPKPSAV